MYTERGAHVLPNAVEERNSGPDSATIQPHRTVVWIVSERPWSPEIVTPDRVWSQVRNQTRFFL